MASLYIQSNQNLAQHPKTRRLARMLKISLPDAIGRLHLLWWWALTYAQDGGLGACDALDLADVVMWDGDADVLLDALVNCGGNGGHGFIDRDEDGGLSLHDWSEHCKVFENRAKTREKVAKYREKKSELPEQVTSNTDNVTGKDNAVTKNESNVTSCNGYVTVTKPNVTPLDKDRDKELKDTPTGAAEAASPLEGQNDRVELLPISESPAAFRQTAEYLLLKTGRKGLTEGDIAALRTLNAAHTPARVLKAIDAAVERFTRKGRLLSELGFEYIAKALEHQTSLPKNGGAVSRKREPEPEFSEPEAREFTQEQEDYLEAKHAGKQLDPEYWAYLEAKFGGGKS